jgi:hypothetical protein
MEFARRYCLSPPGTGAGISCDAKGAFLESVPLLVRSSESGKDTWRPRAAAELSEALSKHFGLPIDIASKAKVLAAIAGALNEGSIARAQLATLFLRFPDPPVSAKGASSRDEQIRFIRELHSSSLLKWDADLHPRWPEHAPDSQGGRFAPRAADLENLPRDTHTGVRPKVVPPKSKPLRSWEDFATHDLKDARPVGGIPFWAIPMIGPEAAEAEIAEEFATALRPGRYARESVPASGPTASEAEQLQINEIGRLRGCHTCGTRNPGTANEDWIGDHQLPTKLNPPLKPQRLYPHCAKCSFRQGGEVTQFLRRLGQEFWDWYQTYARKRSNREGFLLRAERAN